MTHCPKILVFGASGQVGTELCSLLQHYDCEVVSPNRADCDLATAGAAASVIATVRPAFIVNCAAYTAVDRAESEPELANAVNSTTPGEMAQAAHLARSVFIHFSTDYVFDGSKRSPWVEDDPTGPLNVYGKSKLAGERAIAQAGGRYLIFRTSWVYGPHGTNFLRTMLRLGAARQQLSVVDDQIGAPTSSRSLAELCLHVIRRLSAENAGFGPDRPAERTGIYHASSAGSTSWHGFATEIFAQASRLNLPLTVKDVLPIPSSEFPTAAVRPKYSVLDNRKMNECFHFTLPHWRDSLAQVMLEVAKDLP